MPSTLKLTGYLAAEAAIVFSGTQTINSALDNEYTNWSDEIDNSTNLYFSADLRIVLASAAFTGTDSGIEIYLIPTVDGTNYPTWTGDTATDQQQNNPFFVAFVPTTGTTAAQAMVVTGIELPQGKYRWAVRNRGNITLAASGNSIFWRPSSYQSA